VWLNIGIEKMNMHEGVIVKALLDSDVMGMFMDKKTVEKHSFKIRKLERLLIVKNMNRMGNSRGNIIHQVEVNMFYKKNIDRYV